MDQYFTMTTSRRASDPFCVGRGLLGLEAEPQPLAVRRLTPDTQQSTRQWLEINSQGERELHSVCELHPLCCVMEPACDVTNSVKHGTQEANKPGGCSGGGLGNN